MMTCIVCFSERTPIAKQMEVSRFDYPSEVEATYYSCTGCGLISKEPMPTDMDLFRLYRDASVWQFSTPRPRVCWDSAARWIADSLNHIFFELTGKARDVGSKGANLGAALAVHGILLDWECVDPNPTSGTVATGWVGSGLVPSKDCAFVSATHVLEHAANPLQFLTDMLGMLDVDGLAYVEVPSLEGHSENAGMCDDITRDHLWHFTTESLVRMAFACQARLVAYEVDYTSDPGWPVHRLLLSRTAISSAALFERSRQAIRDKYEEAADILRGEPLPETGLYAASHGYAYLMREHYATVWRFPVFDAYRTGKTFGDKYIYSPESMKRFGVKRVFVTTRFWNAYQDIKRWLGEKHPWLEVRSPFKELDT